MPSDHEQSSILDPEDKKLFLEDQDRSIVTLSMQMASMTSSLNKKASSFVGQDITESLRDTNDFRKKASLSFVP